MGQALERLPECRNHGQMELVERVSTHEAWCGVWYRCPDCHSSVLLTSPALEAHLATQAAA